MKRFLRENNIDVNNVVPIHPSNIDTESLRLCNKILTPLDYSKEDVRKYLCEKIQLPNPFNEMYPT